MNTNTKHTPGPWVSYPEHESSSFQGYAIATADGTIIATTGTTNEDACNAALIAAAPEMLEAAVNLLSYLPETTDDFQNKLEAALVAAIAKAEGR